MVKDSSGNYTTAGTATWNSPGTYLSGEKRPSSGRDFVALTWGGEGYLRSSNLSSTGKYKYNGGNIALTRSDSDTYHGYCWQFDEQNSSGVDADSVTVQANLKSTRATSRETNAKFTYIHTYQSHKASASLTVNALGIAAGGVSLSSVNSQWQIAVDVPGIAY